MTVSAVWQALLRTHDICVVLVNAQHQAADASDICVQAAVHIAAAPGRHSNGSSQRRPIAFDNADIQHDKDISFLSWQRSSSEAESSATKVTNTEIISLLVLTSASQGELCGRWCCMLPAGRVRPTVPFSGSSSRPGART